MDSVRGRQAPDSSHDSSSANGDNDINIIEYVRTAGDGNTLLGEWKPISSHSAVPDLFVITLVDDELQVFYPKYGFIVYTMRLDGRKYVSPHRMPLPERPARPKASERAGCAESLTKTRSQRWKTR